MSLLPGLRSRLVTILSAATFVLMATLLPSLAVAQPSPPEIELDKTDIPGTPVAPGENIGYRVDVSNVGGSEAFNLVVNNPIDPLTSLVSGVSTTPLALDDGLYLVEVASPTVVDGGSQPLLLNNDFGIPFPTAVPAAAQATTLGGSVEILADGSFTYTPPGGATGGEIDTFTYMVQNGVPAGSPATDTATATLQLGKPPLALDDLFAFLAGSTNPANVSADNGSGADDFGQPVGEIDAYGPVGGPLTTIPGNAFALPSGNTVNITGGSGNGAFTYDYTVNSAFSGEEQFDYRITNSAGSSVATVTLQAQLAPSAVLDAPPIGVIGGPFTTAVNTPINSSTDPTPSVLLNDILGFPLATVTAVGPSAAPAQSAVPATVNTNEGGTVQMAADGNFVYTPATDFSGFDGFGYQIANGAGNSTTSVSITVGSPPLCTNDNFTALGNVTIDVPAGSGLLSNDPGATSVSAFDATSAQGGTVSVNADGSFTYVSQAGYEGVDTFGYTASNAFPSGVNCTVTVTVTDVVWFVKNNVAPGGDGTIGSPVNSFNALAAAPTENNDVIFIHTGDGTTNNYDGSLILQAGQAIVGEGFSLATALGNLGVTVPVHTVALPAAGTRPQITNSVGDAITLAGNTSVYGVQLFNVSERGIYGNNVHGNMVIDSVVLTNIGTNGAVSSSAIRISNDMPGAAPRDTVVIRNSTFNAPFDGPAIVVEALNTAALGLTVQGNTFNIGANGFNGISASSNATAVLYTSILNNTMNMAGNLSQPINIFHEGTSTARSLVQGNTITGAQETAIFVQLSSGATADTSIIANNITGANNFAQPRNAIRVRHFSSGTHNLDISNNPGISGYPLDIISVESSAGAGSPGPGVQNATIMNNSSSGLITQFFYGLYLVVDDGRTLCANVTGNILEGRGGGSNDIDIGLDEQAGTLNIVQSSLANLGILNNGTAEQVPGSNSPAYSQPACPLPLLP